ncbi:amidohydrolase family protein [Falsirhodobacter halotolerans]|uniref:amidohydrolase family protein n=1 Tax=Falsirhodobacter halotolerans TaxID=1146892 RepID=UPI001FD351F4|nr:amidohydrolase family protein [Falsirhodobacter halotolerans]MCJ8140856.1 amidohydrolase family protein [Falsirhodobacter halotolerans]
MPLPPVPPKAHGTTAIHGRHVLAMQDGGPTLLHDTWVVTEGDRIVEITPHRPTGVDTLHDRPHQFVLPGFMNLHNHCFSEAVARTQTEDGAGRKGGKSVIYTVLMPLTKIGTDVLTAEERMAVARMGILQLLKGGSTTVMEPFRAGLPEMFDAALEMGIRFYGAPYLFSTDMPVARADGSVDYGASDTDPLRDLKVWQGLHDRWQGVDEGRIGLAMSPHATDTCDPDLLRHIIGHARDLGVPSTIHAAQSLGEVETIAARYDGRTPIEYLDWLGVMDRGLSVAHCIQTTDADLRLMAARDTTILNCPRVFARGGTTGSYARFRRHGVRTVVATDGYNMDLLGEVHAAALISKITTGDATQATAPELMNAITLHPAEALRRDDLGRIAVGAKADLTVLDFSHSHLRPMQHPLRAAVWLANRANIGLVMVDGRVLIEGGTACGLDEAAICDAGSAAIGKIWDLPEARAALSA